MWNIEIINFRRLTIGITTLALCGLIFVSHSFARPSASDVTKAFYKQHFRAAERMFFSRQNIRRERKWFTARLYKLMIFELNRADQNGHDSDGNLMKPHISGDVFTASESPPQVFRIGRAVETRNSATVEVLCYWNDNIVGKTRKKLKIVLVSTQKSWLIDNVIQEDGWNIISDFSRPTYFSD